MLVAAAVAPGTVRGVLAVKTLEPVGAEEIALTRAALGWTYGPFEIPADVYTDWDAKDQGAKAEAAWNDKFAAYAKAFPEQAAEFTRRMAGDLPAPWQTRRRRR